MAPLVSSGYAYASVVLHYSYMRQCQFTFTMYDKLICHCVFIYSNFHRQVVTFYHDVFLHCLCLSAEPYETSDRMSWGLCRLHLLLKPSAKLLTGAPKVIEMRIWK